MLCFKFHHLTSPRLSSSTRNDFLHVERGLIQLESYWSKPRHGDNYYILMIVVPCWYMWQFTNHNWVGSLSSHRNLQDTLLYYENQLKKEAFRSNFRLDPLSPMFSEQNFGQELLMPDMGYFYWIPYGSCIQGKLSAHV